MIRPWHYDVYEFGIGNIQDGAPFFYNSDASSLFFKRISSRRNAHMTIFVNINNGFEDEIWQRFSF